MITPFFTINQDDEFIFIDIKVSHIRFNAPDIEMVVENEMFVFSLPPYYLRLRLPLPLVDDERSNAHYDSKSECIKVKLPKLNKGDVFPDLDLTSKMLARTAQKEFLMQEVGSTTEAAPVRGPMIQEMDLTNSLISPPQTSKDVYQEGEQFDWEVKQTMPTEEQETITMKAIKYGFDNQYEGIVGVSMTNGNDINELGNPENIAPNDRTIERLIKENIKFDPEYYGADYFAAKYPQPDDDKQFKDIMEWRSPVVTKFLKWQKKQQLMPVEERQQLFPVEFSTQEQEQMLQLPKKSYLIEDKMPLLLMLVSLLFSYSFDMRETEGDHNIESAWTVGKLTPQIAFLDSQIVIPGSASTSLLRATVITLIRRSLCYPLHRNFDLAMKCWDDVYYTMRGGKRLVLKALLDLRELFRFHDVYYVYTKIWMDDLCAWVISDQVSENTIRSLAHDLRKELGSLQKTEITFEKVFNKDSENEAMEDEDADEIETVNLAEIEKMVEDYQNEMEE
ncbi:hypothetical protein BABINDRAFT_162280 [Babjeviella inositovora NRRL Y-12698]|uniref:CS domain-containing protein n=1 Tax=Babjeviella inositovora NRRL Y-12698 TaxID=984486 RepID=A0A1E3QP68_9ASCO|nr:uncharacterized protein BABINDRAFT_162280 [Babjeviella inositovora NRRL Y-12698]ODQ79244.1 hypothetical protein BABINDRAFT_162280 [Babjeviella inositovora NRRL Y-12698]